MQPIAPSPTARLVLTALVLLFIGLVLWALSNVVLLVFTAVLLAVLLRGLSRQFAQATGLSVNSSLALVTIAIVLALLVFGFLVGPRFASEGQQLVKEIYAYFEHIQHSYGHGFWMQAMQHLFGQGNGLDLGPFAPKLLTLTFGTLGGLLLMLITALYLAIAPDLYVNGLIRLVPLFYRERTREILAATTRTLRYWMLGQLIDMAVVGALSTVGLLILGVPLPIALGVIAGLLTFIPYIGAILAGIPAVIVASTQGLSTVIWVIGLYFVCHMVEGYLVAPVVTRRMVRVPPAMTVLAMSAMGTLYGFFGVLIATPVTAAVIVLVREIYVRDVLSDRARNDVL